VADNLAAPSERQSTRTPGRLGSRLGARARWGRGTVDRAATLARRETGNLAVRAEMLRMRLSSSRRLAGGVPSAGEEEGWRFLLWPALLGFVALIAVAIGASLPSSPFKLEMAGTWFFGVPSSAQDPPTQANLFLGLVAVYGGMILLMRAWIGLTRALERRPGVPITHLWWILALWMVPMLVVAPIFSRDVFSYAAQGEMMSRHINPYFYGPGTLGAGPYPNPVDPLWINTPAPYGPLFLMVDGFFATVSLHHQLVTVILLRLLEVGGVALIAYCIPLLARAYGRDPGPVFTLAVLNPLVLLTLVGGAHNDAIMIGLLLAGITAAKYKHPVWGVVLCALAAAIKAPAALGIIYVGWDWLGTGIPWRQRVRPVITAGLIAVAVMAALSLISGLGWGWIANLETPGTVRSWLAPATGIGMLVGWLSHLVGLGVSSPAVLSVTRVIGLFAAAGSAVYLLWNADRIGSLKALGFSMFLFVVLGPVVQPWYLTWGLILLAPVAVGWIRGLIIVSSVISPFIGLPGGRTLLDELIHANPLAVAAALVVLLGVLVAPLGRWARPSWSLPSHDTGGATWTSVSLDPAIEG
jgi:hypothetical protein